MPVRARLFIGALVLGAAGPAMAQSTYDEGADPPEPGQADSVEPDAEDVSLRIPCLEDLSADGQVRKGVQRRPFLKKHRFEVTAVGGLYASDVLSSTYTYGGAGSFYFSEDFALEVLVTHAPVSFDLEKPFTSFDGKTRFESGSATQAMASMLFVPMQAKFKFSEEGIYPADIFLVGGVGRTFHDSVQGLTWEAGVGMRLFLGKYFDMRVDVRDFIVPQEVLGRARISNNLLVTLGVGVWAL
ncbi:MAG: outer membrane beta-barrel domain-containing protein [Deltaproteobacteria bacterium]|nr:outer membrane beta-barrel domain-containing protein [Deltaproteobacteria bacterium]